MACNLDLLYRVLELYLLAVKQAQSHQGAADQHQQVQVMVMVMVMVMLMAIQAHQSHPTKREASWAKSANGHASSLPMARRLDQDILLQHRQPYPMRLTKGSMSIALWEAIMSRALKKLLR